MEVYSRERFLEQAMPNSAEAERALIGKCMLDNAWLYEAMIHLEPEDFYVQAHVLVYRGLLSIAERGESTTPILLLEWLRTEGVAEQVGGLDFISHLTEGLPVWGGGISDYIKVIKAKSLRRHIIKESTKTIAEAYEGEESEDELLDRAGGRIMGMLDQRVGGQFTSVGALISESLEAAQRRQETGSVVTGVPTDYTELDAMTLGLQPSDLIIVAARPSMGKTSLGLGLAQNAAFRHNAVVAVFSLEMSKESLGIRIVCSEARVDSLRLRSGYLNKEEWKRLGEAEAQYHDSKLFIDDKPGISVLYLRAQARRLAMREKRLDLIVVDYLQLMRGSSKKSESRQQEVSEISRSLKEVAKEFNVPLVVMSQLNRASENRSDHRPQLADLRESGSIEQDADLVAFIYREEQYNRTEENAGLAELIIAKQRNGATGTVRLSFLKEFTRFENMRRE
jgi:replicative DNA helicase